MHKLILRGIALFAAFVLVATVAPAVFAHDGEDHSDSSDSKRSSESSEDPDSKDDKSDRRAKQQEKATDRKEAASKRLAATKLKVCEQRKKNIESIMTRGVTRAQKQLDLFKSISARVEAFYAKKGKVLANYDELLAAVNDAHTKAQAELDALKDNNFSCNSDDPHSQADQYKEDAAALRASLKTYRTAVKDFIVGVKSVQSDDKAEGAQQ